MADKVTIACGKVESLPDYDTLIAGTIVKQCARCSADVWVSPSSQKILTRYPDAQILCTQCTLEDNPQVLALTKDQVKEIDLFLAKQKERKVH